MSERSWTGAVPPSGGCNHRGNLKLKFDGGRNAVLCEDCRTVLGYARHTEPASNEDERMPECPREGCPATIEHDGERVVYPCSRQLGRTCPAHEIDAKTPNHATRCYTPRTQPAPAEDERITAWHKVADHPAFRSCFPGDGPLLPRMLAKLDEWASLTQPPAVVLPTVDEASEAVSIAAHQGGSYTDYAQAVLDLIAARVPVWVTVEPGTVIKAGTRIRSEGEGGSAHEYTAGMDFSIDDPGAWAVFIDPRTVPAESDAALIAELRQYVTSATSDDELRDMIAAVRKADDAEGRPVSIAARWAGWCHECGGRWQLGDQIERGRSHGYAGWTHAVCPDAADPLPDVRPGEVACPACWLIHPAGACDL